MLFDLYFLRRITPLGKSMVRQLNHKIARTVNALFPGDTGFKILEIGPGVGTFADELHNIAKNRCSYYAIEPNLSLCKAGADKGYTFINASIPPFPDHEAMNNFDCGYMSHVMEHFESYPAVINVLNGLHNVLKKDGYLIIVVPDYLDWKADFFNGDYSHSYITTERRLRELVCDMGFTIEKIQYYRACYTFPQTILIYPVHVLIKIFAGTVYNFCRKLDVMFKMKVTFARNILIICKKK